MIHPEQSTFTAIVLAIGANHPSGGSSGAAIRALLGLSHHARLFRSVTLGSLRESNQWSHSMVPLPVIRAGITQNDTPVLFPSTCMFARGTNLTSEIGQLIGGFVGIGIDGTRGVVFGPMQSARIAMVSAEIISTPVGCLAGVTIFAELCADEEGIKRIGWVDGFVMED
jgi:hypothetical protein